MYFFLPPPLPIPIITCECLHTLAHSNGTGGGDNRHFTHRERWIFNELPLSLGNDKNLRIFNTWIKFERYETVPPTPTKLLNTGVCVFPSPSILILVFSFQNDSTCLVHITFSLYIPYNFHLMFPSIFFFKVN